MRIEVVVFMIQAKRGWRSWAFFVAAFFSLSLMADDVVSDMKPVNGTTGVPLYASLEWLPTGRARSFHLYLGTDASAVGRASTNAPEFLGEIWCADGANTVRYSVTLKPYTQYFWRVDAVDEGGARSTGGILNFTTAFNYLEDIVGATGYRFSATDNLGAGLDTLQIIENPAAAGYIGVYHSLQKSQFQIRLALSTNLLNWTFVRALDLNGSMPALFYHPQTGGFLLAHEQWSLPHSKGTAQLHFRYYPSYLDLLAGKATRDFLAPFSSFHSTQLEGTPNFFGVSRHGELIRVGFHYYSDYGVDRNAQGTLSGFLNGRPSWRAQIATNLNEALIQRGAVANIGDRDMEGLFGSNYLLQEGQLKVGDFGSWRLWFYDYARFNSFPLRPKTPKGSLSFSNGTWRWLTSPRGKSAIVGAFYIFAGQSSGEGGQLVFYHEVETAATGFRAVPSRVPNEYQLRWQAGAGAETHRVYLGADARTVEMAAPGGPLCLGQVSRPHLNQVLAPGTCYYLRVDEIGADGRVSRGAVWSFTTALNN